MEQKPHFWNSMCWLNLWLLIFRNIAIRVLKFLATQNDLTTQNVLFETGLNLQQSKSRAFSSNLSLLYKKILFQLQSIYVIHAVSFKKLCNLKKICLLWIHLKKTCSYFSRIKRLTLTLNSLSFFIFWLLIKKAWLVTNVCDNTSNVVIRLALMNVYRQRPMIIS